MKTILQPVFVQVLLTLLVWIRMYYVRLTSMARKKTHPQSLADESQAQLVFQEAVNPSDNFENLFEMPVLFYVAALLIYVTNTTDSLYLNLAWTFVALRAVHSYVHCTCNRITLRFAAYALSSIALWAIWIRIGMDLW